MSQVYKISKQIQKHSRNKTNVIYKTLRLHSNFLLLEGISRGLNLPPDGWSLCIPIYVATPQTEASPFHQHQKNLQVLQILPQQDLIVNSLSQTPRQPWTSWELAVLTAPKHQVLRHASNVTRIINTTQTQICVAHTQRGNCYTKYILEGSSAMICLANNLFILNMSVQSVSKTTRSSSLQTIFLLLPGSWRLFFLM